MLLTQKQRDAAMLLVEHMAEKQRTLSNTPYVRSANNLYDFVIMSLAKEFHRYPNQCPNVIKRHFTITEVKSEDGKKFAVVNEEYQEQILLDVKTAKEAESVIKEVVSKFSELPNYYASIPIGNNKKMEVMLRR